MPLRVRIKILAAILFAILAVAAAFSFSAVLGFILSAAILLYVEAIYPRWNFFGSAILDVKSKGPNAVAITFDDGPSEWTPAILDVLKQENVKATFFLLGKNIERHPQIARRIESEGHAIGWHGYSHVKFHNKGTAFISSDLNACLAAFHAAQIKPSSIIRFPHGFKNIFAVHEAKKRGLRLAGWGMGVWDSKRPGVEHIVKHSLALKAGEILLLHDGNGVQEHPDRSQTAAALPQIIQGLRARGFEFVTLE